MEIHAYQEIYLNKVQSALGDAFDYAINVCNINGEDFIKMFVVSSVSKRIERGEPNYLVGKSGIELLIDVVKEATGKELSIEPNAQFGRSKEYWIGWAVAYYQWYSDRKFGQIFSAFSYTELSTMYNTLHEADISKFVDIADRRMHEFYYETNLKRMRTIARCSQAELANKSGVGLRSIQMYEQRNKDINKAGVETIYRLAKALGCTIDDLIEK